jgi:hypothetical protein
MTHSPASPAKADSLLRSLACASLSALVLAPLSVCAETKLLRPTHESQSLIIENNNLSALDFYALYTSKQANERRLAELYLLGVVDATEGKDWCGYKTIQTITVDEAIYTGFKKLDKSELAKRASTVIRQILSSKFPCGARP